MRVALVVRSLARGGTERQVVMLADGLRRAGHDAAIIVLYPGGPLTIDARQRGVPVRSLDKKGRWDAVAFAARFVADLRDFKPDVVYGFLDGPNFMTLLAPIAGRGIQRIWGLRASGLDAQLDWLPRALRKIEPALARGADWVVANSNAGRDDALSRGFPESKLRVIPNGIDTERFQPDSAAGRAFRDRWGIPAGHPVVGRVGRMTAFKGYPDFLRAAALVRSHRPETRFVCVGDSEAATRAELRQLQAELRLGDAVVWVPGQDDMASVYNALEVLASSSTGVEGFPNVLAEAMACGVPCVATDVGDSAFVVGASGAVVPPSRPDDLAGAILGLLEQMDGGRRPSRLSEMARQRVTGEFSQMQLASRTLALLGEAR